jgi:hypothetical protein
VKNERDLVAADEICIGGVSGWEILQSFTKIDGTSADSGV